MIKKRFEVLDSFRGLFALSIVVFHMGLVGSITELNFFRGSAIFVEFFFVLSGFVITHSFGFRADLSFKFFFISRTFRLFPLHIVMLFVFIFLELGKLIFSNYGFVFNGVPFTHSAAPKEIIPNMFLIQAWTPFFDNLSFNTPSWSISIEYYMYMIFFAIVVFLSKYKILLWFFISISMFYLIFVDSDLFVDPVKRGISCFFAGSMVYVVYKNIIKIKDISINYLLGDFLEIFCLFLVVFIVSSDFHYRSLIASLIFCLTILVFSFERGLVSNFLKYRMFKFFGELSYSIYMVHLAVLFLFTSAMIILQKVTGLSLAPIIDGKRIMTMGDPLLNNITIFIIILIIISISFVTNKYIEKKWQVIGKSFIKKQKV